MSYAQPTKAVPGGCVIAFLGFFLLAIGCVFGWAVWKGLQLPSDERHEKWLSGILQLGGGALLCVLLGVAMIYFGLRLTTRADITDPYSDSKPAMRF
jgi:hypothetical protein